MSLHLSMVFTRNKVRRNILGERDSPDVTIQVEKRGEIIFIAPGSLILD